jgi:hypothetical protein
VVSVPFPLAFQEKSRAGNPGGPIERNRPDATATSKEGSIFFGSIVASWTYSPLRKVFKAELVISEKAHHVRLWRLRDACDDEGQGPYQLPRQPYFNLPWSRGFVFCISDAKSP